MHFVLDGAKIISITRDYQPYSMIGPLKSWHHHKAHFLEATNICLDAKYIRLDWLNGLDREQSE